MKSILLILAVLAPLFAQADVVKVKGSEIGEFRANLAVLTDGSIERVVDQGLSIYGQPLPPKVARTPFDFSGETRLTLINNLAVIDAKIKGLQEAAKSIETGFGITAETKADDPVRKESGKKVNELLERPIEMDLKKIAMADLNLGKNPLGSTVVALAPLINELSPAVAPPTTAVAPNKK